MNNDLRDVLCKFKELTLVLIEKVQGQDVEVLEQLFNERQALIEEMNEMTYSQSEFAALCTEMKLSELQQKLSLLLKEEINAVKINISKFYNMKNASKNYNKSQSLDSIFFNKKI